MGKTWKRLLGITLSVVMILGIALTNVRVSEGAVILPKDLKGSFAKAQITSWVKAGILNPYKDKTFKPKANITRTDFIAIAKKALGYNAAQASLFRDLSSNLKKPLSRQDGAMVICKIMKLTPTKNTAVLGKIKDLKGISETTKAYISTAMGNGFMKLYTGNLFKPTKIMTREDAILLLYRAAGVVFNKAGTYTKADGAAVVAGNATVNTAGVTLKNITINGNLYLTEGIGEGTVTLENVKVKGKTFVWGGGINSIHIKNSSLGATFVNKKNGQIRLVASGNSVLGNLLFSSGGKLSEENLTGSGFGTVTISQSLGQTQSVRLNGNFTTINVNSSFSNIEVESGVIQSFSAGVKSLGAKITLGSSSIVNSLVLLSSATISGSGSISMADVRSSGVTMEKRPVKLITPDGISVKVGGSDVLNNPVSPSITSATLDIVTGRLTLSGQNFASVAGSNNDITPSKFTLTDGTGGHSRTLQTTGSVEILSNMSAIIWIASADLSAISTWARENGTALNGNPYNLQAAAGWNGPTAVADLTGNSVMVSGSVYPVIHSGTLDIKTGILTLTGANFKSISGSSNDILASMISISDGVSGHYRLLSSTNNAEISSSTTANLLLNSTDLNSIAAWATQNGTSNNGKAYNIGAIMGWNGPSALSDLTGNPLTITGNNGSTLTSATLDISTGLLIVTANNLIAVDGVNNDITAAKLTISDGAGGHSRTLSTSPNVEILSPTMFLIRLHSTDLTAIAGWAAQNGTSVNGYPYNLAAVAGWNGTNSSADLTGNPITVSGSNAPSITSATLNVSTGVMVITGTGFTSITGSTNDITAAKFTVSNGSGGHSRTLSTTSNVEITNGTTATLTIAGADLTAIRAWALQNGTILNSNAYNIAAAAGWNGANTVADLTGNPITVSGNAGSTITEATLNTTSGLLVLTGNNLASVIGTGNDIQASKLTISDGAGGHTRTLSTTTNVDISSSSMAIITIAGADLTSIAAWATQNGTTVNGYAYNVAAATGWNGADAAADLTGNPITVSGNAQPTINSATLNVSTGALVLSGANLISVTGGSNDILATMLTISDGAGGHSKTLTSATPNGEITNSTTATITITGADLTAIKAWATQNGVSLNGNTYNIAAAAGWNGVNSGEDLASNPLTLAGNPLPTVTSATLDISTGNFILSGTNFIQKAGAANDITASKLTISDGAGGHTLTLSAATSDVEITNSTTGILTIAGADLTAIASWATQNGTSVNGKAYNIAAAAGWNGADAAADLTGNSITVSGNSVPVIQGAVRDNDTQITVTLSKLATPSTITKANHGGFTVSDTLSPGTTYAVSSIAPGATNDKIILTVADTGSCAGLTVTYTAGGNGTVADQGGNLLATNALGVAVTNGAATDLLTVPTLAANGSAGQTVITLGALAAGNSYRYLVSLGVDPVATPLKGYNATSWTSIASGGVIYAANGKNIGIAEVDAGNRVIRFRNVVAVSDAAAESLAHGVIFNASPATIGNTVIGLGAPFVEGNTFKYIISTNGSAIPTPIVGYDASGWTTVTSGTEITVENFTHIGIAEVDASNRVVRFTDALSVTKTE